MHYLVELNEMNRQIKLNGLANISTSQYRNSSSDMDVNITKPIMSCLPSTIQSPLVEVYFFLSKIRYINFINSIFSGAKCTSATLF